MFYSILIYHLSELSFKEKIRVYLELNVRDLIINFSYPSKHFIACRGILLSGKKRHVKSFQLRKLLGFTKISF